MGWVDAAIPSLVPDLCYAEHGVRAPCSKAKAFSRRLFVIMPKITSLLEPVFDL